MLSAINSPSFQPQRRASIDGCRPRSAPLLLAIQLALGSAIAVSAVPAHAEAVAERRYEITAGPLAEVLNRFAQQAGVALVVDANAIAGLHSPGLSGSYGIDEGFDRLLSDSGFVAVDQGNGDYLLQAVKRGAAVQLPAVQVTSYEPLNAGVSGNRSEVTADEIELLQANDLSDLFRRTPSVAVGGSLGIAEKIYVRGLEDALLSVSIDGATQAGVLFHHAGRLSVEPELLKQVEVHAGAGLATDGPGALAGAVRFTTKDPEEMLRAGERVGALLKAGYYDNTEGYKVNANLFGRLTDNWSALVSVSQADGDAITDGDGNELNGTESEQQMGFAKIVGQLTEDQTLRLSHEQRRDEGIRAQRPQWVISSWNPGYPLESRRETTTLNYQWNPTGNPLLDLEATLYDTYSEIEQDVFDRWGIYHGGSESVGGDLRNTFQLASHALTVGTDYRRDKVNAGPSGDENAQRERGDVTGYYLQDLWQLSDALLFSAGARYDLYELDDNRGQRFESEGFSPNVGFSYHLTPELSLNAAYAEALRGRTTTETFLLDSRTNSPDIEAEEARNTEVGFEYRRDALAFSGTFYRARIDNAINDQARVFRNIGDIETDGYDLRVSYDWQRVQAGLSYSNYDSQLVGGDTDLDLNAYDHGALGNTIGNTWALDIAWQLNDALRFGWNSRVVERVDNVKTSAGSVDQPGYAVHDIYARWQATSDITLTLTVLNLFDKHYVDHATNASYEHIPGYEGVVGLAEPGRDVRMSAAWRW